MDYKIKEFSKISTQCKDLIDRMLCKDAGERISTHDALNHEWFVDEQQGLSQLTADAFSNPDKNHLSSNLSD